LFYVSLPMQCVWGRGAIVFAMCAWNEIYGPEYSQIGPKS
jgi:hypothetical protein